MGSKSEEIEELRARLADTQNLVMEILDENLILSTALGYFEIEEDEYAECRDVSVCSKCGWPGAVYYNTRYMAACTNPRCKNHLASPTLRKYWRTNAQKAVSDWNEMNDEGKR